MNSMSAVSKLVLNFRSDITYLGPTWTKTSEQRSANQKGVSKFS